MDPRGALRCACNCASAPPPLRGRPTSPPLSTPCSTAALSFNDTIVRESLATQPSPKVLAEVRLRWQAPHKPASAAHWREPSPQVLLACRPKLRCSLCCCSGMQVHAIVHAATRTEAAEQQQAQGGGTQADQRQQGGERQRATMNPTDSQSLDDFLVGAVMEDSFDML